MADGCFSIVKFRDFSDTGIYTFVCCILVCGSKADMSAAGTYSYSLPSFGVRFGCRLSLLAFGTVSKKLYLML